MMKYLIYFLLVVLLVACNVGASDEQQTAKSDSAKINGTDTTNSYIHHFADTALEKRITDVLMKLPLVIKTNRHIDSISNHRHSIAFILDDPGKDETDIAVQAGYNGEERFETYYRFFVDPKTLEIKVYDPVEGEKLTLKAYLKKQQP